MDLTNITGGSRPFLVVVRAGDQSLHRKWMRAGEPRAWDLMVNYWGGQRNYRDAHADLVATGEALKYPTIAALYRSHPALMQSYQAALFLDDDVDLAFADIDRLFALFQAHDLWLAQPSLSHDSYWNWKITLNCPLFEVHFTNFVEIMAPVFSRRALASCIGTFDHSVSGAGLDLIWPKLLGLPRDRIGIIDAVSVRHTRKTDREEGALYKHLRAQGVDWEEQIRSNLARHGIASLEFYEIMYGFVVREGAQLRKYLLPR